MNKAGKIMRWARIALVIAGLCLSTMSSAHAQTTVNDTVNVGNYQYTYDAFGKIVSSTWTTVWTGTYVDYTASAYYNDYTYSVQDTAGNVFVPPSNGASPLFDQIVKVGYYQYTYDAFGNVISTLWIPVWDGTYGQYAGSPYNNNTSYVALNASGTTFVPPTSTDILNATCSGSTDNAACHGTTDQLTKVIHQGYYTYDTTYTYDRFGNVISSTTVTTWHEVWTGSQADWFGSPYEGDTTYCTGFARTRVCYPLVTLDDAGNAYTPLTQQDLENQIGGTAGNMDPNNVDLTPGSNVGGGSVPPFNGGAVYQGAPSPYPDPSAYPPLPTTPTSPCADQRKDPVSGLPSAARGSTAQMGADTALVARNLDAAGQDKLMVQEQAMQLIRPINVASDYCLQSLMNLFKRFGDLGGTFGLTDISTALTKAIVNKLIADIAASLSTSCQSFTSSLSGALSKVQQNVQNRFCFPLPALDISATKINIDVPTIPCNGTSLIDPRSSSPSSNGGTSKVLRLFNRQ